MSLDLRLKFALLRLFYSVSLLLNFSVLKIAIVILVGLIILKLQISGDGFLQLGNHGAQWHSELFSSLNLFSLRCRKFSGLFDASLGHDSIELSNGLMVFMNWLKESLKRLLFDWFFIRFQLQRLIILFAQNFWLKQVQSAFQIVFLLVRLRIWLYEWGVVCLVLVGSEILF